MAVSQGWTVTAYKGALTDLTAGNLTSATTMSALMLSGTYAFGYTHAFASITPNEITATGYARCTRSTTFTVEQQKEQWRFINPSPSFLFAAFTGSFRQILIYNATTNVPYLLVKYVTRYSVSSTSAFTLSSGGLPWLIVSAQ